MVDTSQKLLSDVGEFPRKRDASISKRVYEILEIAIKGDTASNACDAFITVLILLNVAAMILETMHSVGRQYEHFFVIFEFISVFVFTVEYVLRVWVSTENPACKHPVKGRLKYIFSPLALVDLLAFLPFYLTAFMIDFRFLRMLRLLRIARVAKLGRYSVALQTLGRIVVKKKEELISVTTIMLILVLIAASLVYYAEKEAQPEAFSNIPAAMWWSVAALATIGYGDICPVTSLGKFLAAIVSILGVGMYALPTAILGAGFIEEIQIRKKGSLVCPSCGHSFDGHVSGKSNHSNFE